MKNLLILIVAAAVYLHFYPEPKLNSWLNEQKNTALSAFGNATDTKVRLKSDKIYTDLQPEFEHFNSEELAYLKEITSNRTAVIAFFDEYCKIKKQGVKFHGANQDKVCKAIANYQSFF